MSDAGDDDQPKPIDLAELESQSAEAASRASAEAARMYDEWREELNAPNPPPVTHPVGAHYGSTAGAHTQQLPGHWVPSYGNSGPGALQHTLTPQVEFELSFLAALRNPSIRKEIRAILAGKD